MGALFYVPMMRQSRNQEKKPKIAAVRGWSESAEICLPELLALVEEMTKHGHVGEELVYAMAKEAGVGKLAHAGRQRIEKAIARKVE